MVSKASLVAEMPKNWVSDFVSEVRHMEHYPDFDIKKKCFLEAENIKEESTEATNSSISCLPFHHT